MGGYGPPHPEMHWHPHHWGGGFGPGPDPSMALSALNTVFWILLFIGLASMLLWWVFPLMKPIIADLLDRLPAESSSLDILRQRYAAGEIDAQTFARMREQLVASYQPKDIGSGEDSHMRQSWNGYKETLPSPGSYEPGMVMMMEQEQYRSDGE